MRVEGLSNLSCQQIAKITPNQPLVRHAFIGGESTHLRGLFLEGVQYSVDELLLQLVVNVCSTQVPHDLLDGFHHHLAVLLGLVFQVIHNSLHNLCSSDLVGQLHSGVYEL